MPKEKLLIVLAVCVLAAAGAIAWIYYLPHALPAAQPEARQHALNGTLSTTTPDTFTYIEDKPYYSIAVHYPAHTALSGAADANARLTMEQALAERIAQFKKDGNLDNLTQDDIAMQGLGEGRKYTLTIEYKEHTADQFNSYVFSIYEDTLGAHPNGFFQTFVFDESGNLLTLDDFLHRVAPLADTQALLGRISALVTAQVTAQVSNRLGTDAQGALFADGLAPKEENFSNFYVEGGAMGILIPPYQAAAYAAGSFETSIPLSELSAAR